MDDKLQTVMCIFVSLDSLEMRRERIVHPGMDVFIHEWTDATPLPNSPGTFKQNRYRGRFYWDHMDAMGNHVFRQCGGSMGEKI